MKTPRRGFLSTVLGLLCAPFLGAAVADAMPAAPEGRWFKDEPWSAEAAFFRTSNEGSVNGKGPKEWHLPPLVNVPRRIEETRCGFYRVGFAAPVEIAASCREVEFIDCEFHAGMPRLASPTTRARYEGCISVEGDLRVLVNASARP